MRCNGLDFFLAMVFCLQRISHGVESRVRVLDDHIVAWYAVHISLYFCSCICRVGNRIIVRSLPEHGPLHLVKDRVVTAVNRITAVDVGDHGVADLLWARLLITTDLLEICLLVCACMRSQHGLIVDIIGVCTAATRVVRREAKNVKVLRN